MELSRWGSAGADNAKFVQLKQAILSRRVLSFTYVGASGQTTRRSVLPARLVFKGRDWYLQGFCLERAAYRTFKLTRMLEPEPGAPFQRPLSPPPIEAFCIPVRLRFSPALAYRVYDEFDEGCVTRGADGSLTEAVMECVTARQAQKLRTPMRITFSGDVTGTVSFDGSGDVSCSLSASAAINAALSAAMDEHVRKYHRKTST